MSIYTGFDLVFRATSLQAAAQMNLSAIFSASGSTNVEGFALLFDALLATDYRKTVTLASGFSYVVCKGAGLRVAMRMVDIKADVKLTFAAVAAQTTLGQAATSYKVEGIGLSTEVIEAFLAALPLSGSFDDTTFKSLRSAIAIELPKYLRSKDVQPGEYAVPLLGSDDDPAMRARAINYAAVRVARRQALKDALGERPADIPAAAIIAAYAQLTLNADPTSSTKPTTDQADRAGVWLATGSLNS